MGAATSAITTPSRYFMKAPGGSCYPLYPDQRKNTPMHTWLFVALLSTAGTALLSQAPLPFDSAQGRPKDWIDADTGHRVVRLTGDAGGSTLYFHDNAFSPE